MVDNLYPSLEELRTGQKLRKNALLALLIVTIVLVIGTMTAIAYFVPGTEPSTVVIAGLAIIVCIMVPTLVCYFPRIGIYFLFGASLLFPGVSGTPIPTMPTSYVPFWWNFSTAGQVYAGTNLFKALPVSPGEFLMMLTFLVWIVKSVVMREFSIKGGVFFGAIAAYTLMVLFGFINGVAHSNNMTMGLYEVRGQAYFFAIYVMTTNIFTSKEQLKPLLWLILGCTFLQGVFAAITYFAMNGTVTEEGFMSHDESTYLSLLIFTCVLSLVIPISKKYTICSFIALIPAVIAILGNQRRAGIAAVIIAFIPILPLLYLITKQHRKKIMQIGIVIGIGASIYMPLAWNSEATWALGARAIRSQTEPNARDNASNVYRDTEAFDVKFTRDQSPIWGVGYGSPFLQPLPLPAVSTEFVYYMPHNSLLWVWMRIGHIGFFLFYMMVATILVKGLQHIKLVRDSYLLMMGILTIVTMLMVITTGKYDLALINCRMMSLLAVLVGVLAILPTLQKKWDEDSGYIDEDLKPEFEESDGQLNSSFGGAL